MTDTYLDLKLNEVNNLNIGQNEKAVLREVIFATLDPYNPCRQVDAFDPRQKEELFAKVHRLGLMTKERAQVSFSKLCQLGLLSAEDDHYIVHTKIPEAEETPPTKRKHHPNWGGRREGAGPKRKADAKRVTICVKVNEEERELLSRMGKGNISAGLRSILESAIELEHQEVSK